MKKVRGIFFAVSVLCFWVMASLVIAAPPGSQLPKQLRIPDQSLPTFPDIEATSFYVYDANYGQGPWKLGETVLIRGTYQIRGCLQKPFFGKITMDGTTLIEKEMEQKPDCQYYSNTTWISYDGVFSTNWQATIGTHTIVFKVDSKNDIGEGLVNENNNTLNKTITVLVPTLQKKDINIQPMPTPEIIKPKPEPPGWK